MASLGDSSVLISLSLVTLLLFLGIDMIDFLEILHATAWKIDFKGVSCPPILSQSSERLNDRHGASR